MVELTFSTLELAQLAAALGAELKRLERDFPEWFEDPESYASGIKTIHRRILSTIPGPD